MRPTHPLMTWALLVLAIAKSSMHTAKPTKVVFFILSPFPSFDSGISCSIESMMAACCRSASSTFSPFDSVFAASEFFRRRASPSEAAAIRQFEIPILVLDNRYSCTDPPAHLTVSVNTGDSLGKLLLSPLQVHSAFTKLNVNQSKSAHGRISCVSREEFGDRMLIVQRVWTSVDCPWLIPTEDIAPGTMRVSFR